jgi:hypothetical protein
VILAGTNDIAGNLPMTLEAIEGNLASMSELARGNGIRVVLASVLPVYEVGRTQDGRTIVMTDRRPPEKILAVNEWIKNYASKHGDTYLDYFSAMEKRAQRGRPPSQQSRLRSHGSSRRKGDYRGVREEEVEFSMNSLR